MKWRIQDFSDGEGRRQPVIGSNFIRNCMKIKEIGIERVRLVRLASGGHASYWNAFLLHFAIVRCRKAFQHGAESIFGIVLPTNGNRSRIVLHFFSQNTIHFPACHNHYTTESTVLVESFKWHLLHVPLVLPKIIYLDDNVFILKN